ncbi:hypothetical protein [Actinomadura kijaniata]|uniref:hypothetical protein n=1 Tax=Actinomadura kijaniata TaxID=46161 RepID=UPI00082CB208|nr:hypothetical protein [Actinomadura kijaniata]
MRVLNGRYELTVRGLTRSADALELSYRITPPLPGGDDPGPPVMLAVEALDDLGNHYLDGGGAYGPEPGGEATKGTISVQPGPPHEARSVTLTLTFLSGPEESTHKLRLPL